MEFWKTVKIYHMKKEMKFYSEVQIDVKCSSKRISETFIIDSSQYK